MLDTLPHTLTQAESHGGQDAPLNSHVQRLRQDTRLAHEAIEAVPCMRRLLAPDYCVQEYRLLLARLLGYLEPLEARLAAWPGARFHLACLRSPKLRADLAALGMPNQARSEVHPSFDALDFRDESTRAGIIYVFEGATLGGQVIRRTLSAHLGPAVSSALSYFDCYNGAQGQVWRRTIQQIDHAPELDNERMGASARMIFSSLSEWLGSRALGNRSSPALRSAVGARCPFSKPTLS